MMDVGLEGGAKGEGETDANGGQLRDGNRRRRMMSHGSGGGGGGWN